MAKYACAEALQNGPAYIKANATRMMLVSGYTFGDSYATVVAAKLAEVVITSADFTLGASGYNQVLTGPAGKSVNASAGAVSPNLHIAFTDGSSKVLWVTDETSDQDIISGTPVDFPTLPYTSNQPI